MSLSKEAQTIIDQLSGEGIKLGDIKKIAKEIKKNHPLALELWSSQKVEPRLLAVLIMDKKQLDTDAIHSIIEDLSIHNYEKQNQLADWFLANQCMKDKKICQLMLEWEDNSMPLLRRLFWYYQARLR